MLVVNGKSGHPHPQVEGRGWGTREAPQAEPAGLFVSSAGCNLSHRHPPTFPAGD